ncbi:MAG: 3-phosphoglycerate dehydrogenase, partial [Oscillospiraceae bacterium]
MFTVKTLNHISNIIYDELNTRHYTVGDDLEQYDAALVRSADLLSMELPASLLAVARAGAGVNNIPIDRCSEQGIVVFNTPGANANAVKELVVCGMLLAGRKVIPGVEWITKLCGEGQTG